MAQQPTQLPLTIISPSRLTAVEVVEMYKLVQLPVCDDPARIAEQDKKMRARYLKDGSSPDPDISAKARRISKTFTDLQNDRRRDELLKVIFEAFVTTGDTALATAKAAGLKVLTPDAVKGIGRLAEQYNLDKDLADRFVNDYMKLRSLTVGDAVIKAALVTDFQGSPGHGRITLSWTWPASNCDEIELFREEDPGAGAPGAPPRSVFRGAGTSFVDTSVVPGASYIYRAFSYLDGDKSSASCASAPLMCAADVGQPTVRMIDGSPRLSWTVLSGRAQIVIFRRIGEPPVLKSGAHGLEPADAQTQLVHRGGETHWSDTAVQEGQTYCYRLFADYGAGLFSPGVALQITVPKAPPPVTVFSAEYVGNAQHPVVQLSWQPVRMDSPVEYIVVRREGGVAPSDVNQGVTILQTRQTQGTDEDLQCGRRYTYAVFALSQGCISATGKAAGVIEIVAEVDHVQTTVAGGAVRLEWHPPAGLNECAVLIFRKLRAAPIAARPSRDRDGASAPGLIEPDEHAAASSVVPVPADSGTSLVFHGVATSWIDKNVVENETYHYLIIADFGSGRFSHGVTTHAVVPTAPPAVESLRASYEYSAGRKIVQLEWSSVPGAAPIAYVVVRREGLTPAASVPSRDREGASVDDGEIVLKTAQTSASDEHPPIGRRATYSVFALSQGLYSRRAASAAPVAIFAEVEDLQLAAAVDQVDVSCKLPEVAGISGVLPAVLIFRATQADPDLRMGTHGPEPSSAATTLVHCTNVSPTSEADVAQAAGRDARPTTRLSWTDTAVLEGETYHYTLVTSFGDGIFGRGVTARITVLRSPPEPVSLSAAYSFEHAHASVQLEWPAVTHEGPVQYIVVRREGPVPATAVSQGEIIHKGPQTHFNDEKLRVGCRHCYSVFTWSSGCVSRRCVSAPAIDAYAEVTQLRAVSGLGRVELHWSMPEAAESVRVFRRDVSTPDGGQTPQIRPGTQGPEAADADTLLVHQGPGTSWIDQHVAEGATYAYVVVAGFAQNLFGKGATVRASVHAAPPESSALVATFNPSGEKPGVLLEWQPVEYAVPVRYAVVRQQGATPPFSAESGERLGETDKLLWVDENVENGRRYTYAVFTAARGGFSRKGAASASVNVLAEVKDLRVVTAPGTIELTWKLPPNAVRAVVRCGLESAELVGPGDGSPVPLLGDTHAKADGLEDGQPYRLMVFCVYRPDGGTEVLTPGLRLTATPDRAPDPVQDFRVRALGQEIECAWSAPRHGVVVVIRSAQAPNLKPGDRLSANDLDGLGQRLVTMDGLRAVDSQPDIQAAFYSCFTVTGPQALFNQTVSGVVARDVTELRVTRSRDGAILKWAWPTGCRSISVARRLDEFPESADDPNATIIRCTLADYENAGGELLDRLQGLRGRVNYVLFAHVEHASSTVLAPGAGEGCRASIQWDNWMTVRYKLAPAGDSMKIAIELEDPFPGFAGLALVANQDNVPANLQDGAELLRWTPQGGKIAGAHKETFSLAPVRKAKWVRFFYKLLPIDPVQAQSTLIVHPNLCEAFTDRGEPQRSRRISVPHVYRSDAPKTVICPRCFYEFPSEKILYTSYGDEELVPVESKRSFFDKVLGRAPRKPTDAKGRVLGRKICPNPDCRQELPYTAGMQSSLILGMVGARFSGKSHYIASLVKRLEGQVGLDMQAALTPDTPETENRYRQEFFNPLFRDRLELAATVRGFQDPLIYSFSVNGSLWKEKRDRTAMLSLYDTAGENFDDRKTVQQMVQYLRVSSGIIFLIDPLQSPSVREALPRSVPLPDVEQMADANVMVTRVLTELENSKALAAAGQVKTPVAVVLTKCDVLRDAGLIEGNRLWCTDKRHVGYYDREAHEDMSGMMGELVRRWSPAAYSTVTQRFGTHAFFGASATGCASDQMTRRFRFISPWRSEDPVLWLLSELGVIPTR